MGISMRRPPLPEEQPPMDLGELSKMTAGQYIKADGRWYFISNLNFVSSAEPMLGGAEVLARPHEIELTLLWAPWKKD